jgi:hypothetical protein
VTSTSTYALCAPAYWERGWCVIPTMPGEKRPGEYRSGRWIGLTDWTERYKNRAVAQFEIDVWCNAPGNAGIGLVCGRADGVVGIDIDTDHSEIGRAILSSIPASTLRKRGNKGETVFYKGAGIASKNFNVGKVRVLDVLSDGRFCVLPSSMHPDSGKPYVWTGPDSFADYSPSDLPEITPDHIAAIGEALRPFGWQAQPERPARSTQGYTGSSSGDIWKVLNDKAIANLDKWVPHLSLYSLRQTREGYQAVATWRPSSTGQPIERRKRNLGISTRGIRDFGDDRGYSPIDLVMAARGLDFGEAYDWLEQLVDPSDIVVNLRPKMIPTTKPKIPTTTKHHGQIKVGAWGIKTGKW